MATITELLDADWDRKETTEAIMAIRVIFQNLESVAVKAKSDIDVVVDGGGFGSVHDDLRAEGQACRVLLNQFINALATHNEFINFKPS